MAFFNRYDRIEEVLIRMTVAAGILGALVLRFLHLAGRELWGDEIYQIQQTQGDFKPVWLINTYGDFSAFPGDYLLTYPFVRLFDSNKWGIMIPHIAVTAAGLVIFYFLARRYYRSFMGYLVAYAIISLHQGLVFHAFEFRPYGVLSVLMITVFLLSDILITRWARLGKAQKWGIMAVFTMVLWFHVFGAMMIGCSLLFYVLRERLWREKGRMKEMAKWLGCLAVIAGPLWIWYATGNPDKASSAGFLATGIHPFGIIKSPWESGFLSFFNRVFLYNLIGYKPLYFLLGALAFTGLISRRRGGEQVGFFLTMIFLPVFAILTAALVSGYWFLDRQYVYIVPMFALFLGWLWDTSFSHFRDRCLKRAEGRLTWPEALGYFMMIGCGLGGMIGNLF